jgi:hypothetical protein
MALRDVLKDGARVWFKSEWAPADDYWPAVSFSKRSVGDYLRQEFRPGRDAIVYVGTSSPATTEKPEHRQRLLSAINIEPQQLLETRECVPAESWENAQQNFRGRWWWSMPALAIWEIEGFPSAYDVAPATYRQLGIMTNRGSVVEVTGAERDAVLRLPVHSVDFTRHYKTGSFAARRAVLDLSREVRVDIGNMVARILAHVAQSGRERTLVGPTRTTNESDLHVMLGERWIEQKGRCFLCNGPLFPETKNYLLQSSGDRLDSSDTAYSSENTRITHLGCNLAKNKVTLQEFEDWITVVRGEGSDIDTSVAGVSAGA